MRWLLDRLFLIPVPLGFVAGAWWTQQLSDLPSGWVQMAIALLGLLAAGGALCRHPRWRIELSPLLALVAAVLLGLTWASWRADLALAERIGPELEGLDLRVTGHVVGLATSSPTGRRFHFVVESCADSSPGCPLGRLALNWSQNWSQGFALRAGFERGSAASTAQVRSHALPSPDRPIPSVLKAGDRWTLTVRLKRPRATDNPGTFDAELRMLQEGVIATGYVRPSRGVDQAVRLAGQCWSVGIAFDRLRHDIRDALFDSLGDRSPDAAAVLVALAIGDQQVVSNRWWETFNRTGVGHLMSISGLHITMLAALAMSLARVMLRLPLGVNHRLLLRVPAPYLRWAFGITVAFVYSGLAGWGIPAQRTCWMLAVTGLAVLTGRGGGIGPALALAAAVVTILDPWAPMAAGFWLSFVAVAAIATHGSASSASRPCPSLNSQCASAARSGFPSLTAAQSGASLVARLTPSSLDRIRDKLRALLIESASSQWAATLSLLPLGAVFFSSFSLVSPVANAFAIPLVSGLITPLVLLESLLAMVWPALAGWVAPLLLVPTSWLLSALEWLARWPHATWTLALPDVLALGLAGLAVAMLLRPHPLPMRAAWAFALLPLALGGARVPDTDMLRVHALDVGQGMAILVETRDFRMLYDTGPFWSTESNAGQRILAPWLRARGVRRIDLMVISHPDLDHAGGAADILRGFEVGMVLRSIPPGHPFRVDHPDQRDCRRGERWRRGSAEFQVFHPGEELPPGGARSPTNARSCVLRVSTPSGRVLLTGDLEARQELDMIQRVGAKAIAADILVVPHHGSNTSSTAALIDAVSPRWALVQSGYRNRFGHPTAKVLGRYERAGVEVLRTDQLGAITIELSRESPPRLSRSRVDSPPYWRLR
jgi:competence protein ComEC